MKIPKHNGYSHIETRLVLQLGKGQSLLCSHEKELEAALIARGLSPTLISEATEQQTLVTVPDDHLRPETRKAVSIVALALSRHSHASNLSYWHRSIETMMAMAVASEPDYLRLKHYALPLAIHLLTTVGLTPYFDADGDISAR